MYINHYTMQITHFLKTIEQVKKNRDYIDVAYDDINQPTKIAFTF